jgi:hypothetical protein
MHQKRSIVILLFLLLSLKLSLAQNEPIQAVLLSHLCSEENDHSVWAGSSFILFTSDRNSHFAGKHAESGQYYEQIYLSDRSGNTISKPKLKKLSLSRNHYSIAGQSDNPSVILFYSGQNDTGELYLITIKQEKKSWKSQKSVFKGEATAFRKTSAFYNEKTSELFFTAIVEQDSYGGSDIYIASYNANKPVAGFVNAGNVLNTKGNEEGLFMVGDTLFFASDGHNEKGDFDIYYSVRENGDWQKPIALPSPVNSEYNDRYYVKSGNEIFFSSDRPGGMGGYDLYVISVPVIQPPVVQSGPFYVVRKGQVLDDMDNSPVSARIMIVEVETGEISDSVDSGNDDGYFETGLVCDKNYRLLFSAPGYETYTEVLNISEINVDSVMQSNVYLTKIPVHIPETTELHDAFSDLISSIPDRIIYYQVQVGAFRFIQSISDFRKQFPALDDEEMMTETEGEVNKFLITKKFLEKDSDCYEQVTALQMKVVLQYGIDDAFIVAYTEQGKRIAIIWSFAEKKYKILNTDY